MSTAPLTFAQFASKVRDKYPGAYDSLSDPQLIGKIVDKYPQYTDQIQNYTPTGFEKERTEGQDRGFVSGLKSANVPHSVSVSEMLDPTAGALSGFARNVYDTATKAPQRAKAAWNDPVLSDPRSKLAHAIGASLSPLVGVNPESLSERASHADTRGIAGELAVPTALAVAPLAAEGAAKGTAAGRLRVGDAIRTPEGKLAPVPRALGQAAGAAVGTGGGALLGHPYVGAALGYKLAPSLMEQMFPKSHVELGAPFPLADEFYEHRGADLMRRGDQQAKLDAAQPNPERRPMFPLVGTPEDIAAFDQRMSNLKREAQAGGMYSAARGRVGRKLDYQQRTLKDYTE